MPRKKQAESAKSRRQKLLDYFLSNPGRTRFISDVKNDLNIKNEQNLRRDLEILTDDGHLKKTKDNSKLPARAVYTLKAGASQSLKSQANDADDYQLRPVKSETIKSSPKSAASTSETPSEADGKGRRSARELEQQILNLLDQQPTTVKELAEHLQRQQPTVTKALERMQERSLVERTRQSRSFVYSRLNRAQAAPSVSQASTPAPKAVPAATAPVVQSAPAAPAHSPAVDTGSFGLQNLSGATLQSIIDTAVKAGVQAGISEAINHILAAKSR